MSRSGSTSTPMGRQRKMALAAVVLVAIVLVVILVSYVAAPPGLLQTLSGATLTQQ